MKELKEECDYLKKENFRMHKETMVVRGRKEGKEVGRGHTRVPSESESLSLSINSKD